MQGVIDVVTYHDPNGLYSVLRVNPEKGYSIPQDGEMFAPKRFTAVGRMPEPTEGLRLRLTGKWTAHASHGKQFAFESSQVLSPADEQGLVRYLSSKAFEGIGATLAERIVKKLGEDTLERIGADPRCLDSIRGLRPEVAEKLSAAISEQLTSHRAHAFLRGLGLGPRQSQAVMARFGSACEALLSADPYQLAQVSGLGFATADRVARDLGFAERDPRRLAAGLLHALEVAKGEGHSLLPLDTLVQNAAALLQIVSPGRIFHEALTALESEDEVTLERDLRPVGEDATPVYLPWLRGSEKGLAEGIARLIADEQVRPLANEAELAQAESAANIELHQSQRDAVLLLLREPVTLLTGGPGVGKTTIIRLVAALAEAAGSRIKLASPTGRAAKRLAEATGRPASTIHRLLKVDPEAEGGFVHGYDKPLNADLVIVDEISMLDVVLAHQLVKALRPPTRLILVGDPNQLPSVGPGNVLRDMLDSECVPTARLTHIYRQATGGLIVNNAHRILHGDRPQLPERGDMSSDFYFFPMDEAEATADRLVEVVTQRIPDTFGLDWSEDVQVIAPMYRGECGVDNLNERLRESLGIGGREVQQGDRRWRKGDRVIHTRNDYERELFNGDMGRISSVSADGLVTVRYPDQDVVYEKAQLSDLRPAFAITVHRSQGGEFPAVVLPLVTQHYMMLQRNLLYTAVTRAKRLVVLVGSRRALQMALDNADQALRESALADRLRRLC